MTMQVVLASGRHTDPPAYGRFAIAAVDRLGQMPGAQGAAAINIMPSGGNNSGRTIEIEGQPNQDPSSPPEVDYRVATPETFSVLRVPILRGRSFTSADREGAQLIAVVTHSLAQRYFPIRIRLADGSESRQMGPGSRSWASAGTSSRTGSPVATIQRCIDRSCRRRAARWLCW